MFDQPSQFSPEKIQGPKWVMPDFNSSQEIGELQRVARTFRPETPKSFVELFSTRLKDIISFNLSDIALKSLENTDALSVIKGDWDVLKLHMDEKKRKQPESVRDYNDLRTKMEKGSELDMPVIVKVGDVYHLMSGDTRLMVSRALGILPKVILVDMTELQ